MFKSDYRLYFSILVFIYFFINGVVLLFNGIVASALCCFIISVALFFYKRTSFQLLGIPFFTLLSIYSAASNSTMEMLKPENRYYEKVAVVLDNNYYGDHKHNVVMQCGTQFYKDLLRNLHSMFKAVYYDITLSAFDFIRSQFKEPIRNECHIAVNDIIDAYPELEDKFIRPENFD